VSYYANLPLTFKEEINMNKIKRLLGCGLAAAMILSIAACEDTAPTSNPTSGNTSGDFGTSASTSASTSTSYETDKEAKDLDTSSYSPSGNAGEVSFLTYYSIRNDQKTKEQTLIFEGETFGGKIVESNASSLTYLEDLSVAISGDKSPDLVLFDTLSFPNGISKNLFTPLDDYIDINDPVWDGVKDLIDEFEYKEKHYFLPHRVLTKYGLNYNRKTIENAGLDDPYNLYMEGKWTWDTWRKLMIDFCNIDPENNIGLCCTDTMLEGFINTTGTSIINVNADGTIQNNLNDPDVNAAVDFLAELGRNGLLKGGYISPQDFASSHSDTLLFLSMQPEWTYIAATEQIQRIQPGSIDNYIHDTPSDFAFVPFPKYEKASEYYMCAEPYGFMIPKGAKNIDGAVDFIYCNRLYEIDEDIIKQTKNDHIAPAEVHVKGGPDKGKRDWVITWDEKVYDLMVEMTDSSKFTFIIEDMYGINKDCSKDICKAIFGSTFGADDGTVKSWTQEREALIPVVDGYIAEYTG